MFIKDKRTNAHVWVSKSQASKILKEKSTGKNYAQTQEELQKIANQEVHQESVKH